MIQKSSWAGRVAQLVKSSLKGLSSEQQQFESGLSGAAAELPKGGRMAQLKK